MIYIVYSVYASIILNMQKQAVLPNRNTALLIKEKPDLLFPLFFIFTLFDVPSREYGIIT